MKKWTSVLAVFVAILMIAGGALAQTSGGSVGTPGSAPSSGTEKSKSESPAASPSAPGATSSMGGDFTARHTMEGEVVRVDHKNGHLTLKTAEGNLMLHFPPDTLANVKKGDHMSVELAIKPMGHASTGSKSETKGSASPKY
jgi:hypothetical protein